MIALKRKRKCLEIGLTVVSIFMILSLLEISIRSYDYLKGKGFFSRHRNLIARGMKGTIPFRNFGFKLYREIDGIKYISSRHRELYPLVKPEGTFRIIAFGGSTTVNRYAYSHSKQHHPLLLEAKLKARYGDRAIEVINVGNSGYATPHSIILLALDVISWEPDLVILSFNNNDRFAMYWPKFSFSYSHLYGHEVFIPNHPSRYTTVNVVFQNFQLYWVIKKRFKKGSRQSDR